MSGGSLGEPPPAAARAPRHGVNSEGRSVIARYHAPLPPQREGPRANDRITAERVRLVDHNGSMIGVLPLDEALERAEEAGLDLVEVSPTADPPVCKILDYGKFKYDAQKRAAEARKKKKTNDIQEVKMRPGIDAHDYGVKMRNITKFLDAGDKVKVTLRFRGREMAHQDLGVKVLERVKEELEAIGKVEQFPKMEGRQMTMVLAPR